MMIPSDVGELLPVHGAAGQLLAAAIASPVPASLTRLGEAVGLSKFTASRAGRQLQEAGLLHQETDGRGYVFNSGHPLAELATTIVRVVLGVTPRVPPSHTEIVESRVDDSSYLDQLPEHLRLPGPDGGERAAWSPVTAVAARVVIEQLDVLMKRVLEPEELGQRMYARWGSQRARDVVHQTLHLGTATSAARKTLALEVLGGRPVQRHAVSSWAWARATFLVRAEQGLLARSAELFEQAVEFGVRFRARREDQLYDAGMIARRREVLDEDRWQRMNARQVEIEQMWEGALGSVRNIGGTTAPYDVGLVGDQAVAIMLSQLADQYGDLATRMDSLADTDPKG
ncbi:MAG TPA: hypothetical protein VGL36_35930 [Kribbella sp.]